MRYKQNHDKDKIKATEYPLKSKALVAKDIIDRLTEYIK